jgi:UDP-N-acetylmuramyl pentapeptide phosphotransferase/UDP-N-acetylglucosamine-1-phosphate transferase
MENNDRHVVLECRIAKIELEHEVLLREMEVALVGMIGLPVTAVTLILQFALYQNGLLFLISLLLSVMGLVFLDDYRSIRKEKIVAKEKELESLMVELTKEP